MRVYVVRKWPLWDRSRFVCWNITRVSLWLLCNVHFVQIRQSNIATWPRWPKGTDHCSSEEYFFLVQCHHMSFVDFVVLLPGHGRSVTYFWGWDAHEAQLRCPDGVWVAIEGDVVPGGALNLNSTNLPRPWSPRESSPSRKIPTVEPGIEPGTSWLVVTRPRGWSQWRISMHPCWRVCVWQELEYRTDVCRVTRGAHIEHL